MWIEEKLVDNYKLVELEKEIQVFDVEERWNNCLMEDC